MATKVKKVVLLDRLLSEGFFTSKEEARTVLHTDWARKRPYLI